MNLHTWPIIVNLNVFNFITSLGLHQSPSQ